MSTRTQLIVIDQELLRGRWTFPIAKPSDSNLPMPSNWRKNDKYWIPTTWNVTIGLDFTNIFKYNFYHSILKLYPLWPSGCFPLKWRSNLNKIIFGLSLYMPPDIICFCAFYMLLSFQIRIKLIFSFLFTCCLLFGHFQYLSCFTPGTSIRVQFFLETILHKERSV